MPFRVWGLGLCGAVQGLHGIRDTTLITKNQREKKWNKGMGVGHIWVVYSCITFDYSLQGHRYSVARLIFGIIVNAIARPPRLVGVHRNP